MSHHVTPKRPCVDDPNPKAPKLPKQPVASPVPTKKSDPAGYEALKVRRAEAAERKARMQLASNDPDTLLALPAVAALTGLSASTIYRLVKAGELKVKRRGARCTRFRAGDVRAWLRSQG